MYDCSRNLATLVIGISFLALLGNILIYRIYITDIISGPFEAMQVNKTFEKKETLLVLKDEPPEMTRTSGEKAWTTEQDKIFTNNKFILYECKGRESCGGLADRFKGIISAYAWSLFANRTLIVNISKPCYFERLIIPNQLNWNLNLTSLVETGQLARNFTVLSQRQLLNYTLKDELANIDVTTYANDTDVISVMTSKEWISSFSKNKLIFISFIYSNKKLLSSFSIFIRKGT